MLLSEGQMSDYKGAVLMLDAIPRTKVLIGDRGYDADWLRPALAGRSITACIPSKANRKVLIPHDTVLYRSRHKAKIMLGRLKTGGASQPAAIDAPTPWCPSSHSPPSSSSGSDQ